MKLPKYRWLAATVAVGAVVYFTRDAAKASKIKEGKGTIICPPTPVDISNAARGDFVIIKLQSKDKKSSQLTWGRISSFSPTRDQLYVEIVGEFTSKGILPVRHGFHIGEKHVIAANCVWDVLRKSTELKGQILCGPNLSAAQAKPISTNDVEPGDVVTIVIGSLDAQGTAWNEPVKVRITNISSTLQILYGVVVDHPSMAVLHGLVKYSEVQFGRDCVVHID